MSPLYNEHMYEWITPVLQYRGDHKKAEDIWLTYYTTREVKSLKNSDDVVTVKDMIDMYNQARPGIDCMKHGIWPTLKTACDLCIAVQKRRDGEDV